ncbi:Uncharacterised protein [Mycobacteroides abscessus]|nr:Uncharacterised protein [Mycobacteroides abscessus]
MATTTPIDGGRSRAVRWRYAVTRSPATRVTRRRTIFSPSVAAWLSMTCWTVSPSASAASAASASRAPASAAALSTRSAREMNVSFFATKSVSELSSMSVATWPPSVSRMSTATRPSEVERPSRLATPFRPFTRMISSALSASPPASSRAFLTSSMPAPVRSRRALMSAAV